MTVSKAEELATQAMKSGLNCCESILMVVNELWNLDLDQDLFSAATLFKEGMGSGCTCGALVGMVMASGVLRTKLGLPKDLRFANRLHSRFKQEFKSSCCSVLRKNQSILDRLGNRGCIRITAGAAAILAEEGTRLLSGERL